MKKLISVSFVVIGLCGSTLVRAADPPIPDGPNPPQLVAFDPPIPDGPIPPGSVTFDPPIPDGPIPPELA